MRWSLPWQKRSKSSGKQPQWKKARDLRIEILEDKVLLAVDTWVGGGSNNHWSNAANWQAGVAPSAGDQLVFHGTALTATQNDLTAGTSFQSLEFQANSFSIAGNSFTVTGSITTDSGVSGTSISAPVALSGAVSASVAAGESLSLSGAVSGSGSLTTTASGTLSLSASNSYSGGTTIDAGMVSFASGGLGSSGTITLGGTSTLQWSGSNTQDISSRLALPNAAAATLDTESNTVTLATGFGGSSTASLTKAGSGTLILTGSEGYSGGTTISSGTLQVGNPPMQMSGSLGSGPIVDNGALAIDVSGTTTIAGVISGSGTLSQSSSMMNSNTLVLTGTNTFSGAVSVGSYCTLQVGSGGSSGTLGSGGVSGSGTLTFDSSSTQTVSNTLSGGLNVMQEGSGALVLTGSNSYTGSTTVNSGSTLRLGGSSVLPDGSGAVAVTDNGTLDLDGYSPTLAGLSGSGTVTTSVSGLATL
jgi:autotransporter-associated beta strand protein